MLFPYVITTIKDNNNIEYFLFDDNTCGEIYLDFNTRIYYLSEKDKKLKKAKFIQKIYIDLNEK